MIMIDIDMPENCDECRFNTEYAFCKAMPDNFCGNTDDRKRPEWCPLKEQEAKPIVYTDNPYTGLPVARCPKCAKFARQFHSITTEETHYCPWCGQAVKWNDD